MTTYLRFGEWDKVLATPPYDMPRDWPYQHVLAGYARGVADVRKGRQADARKELALLQKAAQTLTGRLSNYAKVADLVLQAVLAAENNVTLALDLMRDAVAEQVGGNAERRRGKMRISFFLLRWNH